MCFVNYSKKLFERNNFLQVAATSFSGPVSAHVAAHKMVIPTTIYRVCGGQDSHTQSLPSGPSLSCLENIVKCSQSSQILNLSLK